MPISPLKVDALYHKAELKKAIIRPAFKRGDKREFTNHRPISILPVFSKVIEKVMYKRVQEFIDEHNILYQY